MPLTDKDRGFLKTVERLKLYVFLLALAVLIYLLRTPSQELQMATSLTGISLCAMFWLTQRLLAIITLLDFELTRLSTSIRQSAPRGERH